LNFSLKVASRCNINCTYCYVYNGNDTTWKTRPALMSDDVFTVAVQRIRAHCRRSGQRQVEITFHGGEPCLLGAATFDRWCTELRSALADVTDVRLCIQTNATLLDERWHRVLARHDVLVGISMDGPEAVHDRYRVDKRGRGTYRTVERRVTAMLADGVRASVLCVVQLGADGLAVHRQLESFGFESIGYILPHISHDGFQAIRDQYGDTPCADFLLPVLDHWCTVRNATPEIVLFWQMFRVVLGGHSLFDLFGNRILPFVFVETDGSMGGLDTLRVDEHGLAETGLDVMRNDFVDIRDVSDLHRRVMFDGVPLPTGCAGCRESTTCAGGHLADRYSAARGFDNRSVWCADLLLLFGRVRELLEVSPGETLLRRQALAGLRTAGA